MKALVIYDSLYGNTEKVAKALASGMREGGIDVDCVRGSETWEKRTGERGRAVWTDTWVRRDGHWQLVASQDIVVPE